MIEQLVNEELNKYKIDIDFIKVNKIIDCITIFSKSDNDYLQLNNYLGNNKIIDEMPSGNLYYLNTPIKTAYGDLLFIKVRRHDDSYNNYRISVDFIVDDYKSFKKKLINPTIKKYNTFELIQFKNDNSIINIISLSAKEDYNI